MKYFNLSEFDSPDLPGSGGLMNEETLEMLEKAREIAGIPFIINSGYRTLEHNESVGGKKQSAHTRGYAFDLAVSSGTQRMIIIKALLEAGFNRIGVARTFIHGDNDPSLPQNVVWTY